jgi:endoglucanase
VAVSSDGVGAGVAVATGVTGRHFPDMPRRRLYVFLPSLVLTTALASCGGGTAASAPVTEPVAIAVSGDAVAAAAALGRGVNLGNILEAPVEGLWGLRLSDSLFDAARAAGAKTIRLPVRWSSHAGATRPYTIDPVFLARVDYAVDAALSRGMRIVIDMHHYRQLDGDALDPQETSVGDGVLDERFVAMWGQIAQHFRGRPESVLFELYNEPHGNLTAQHWNLLVQQALAVVRAVDVTHYIVVGPVQWNSASQLDALALPDADRRLIVTIHNYEPFTFTHQGADWVGMANSPVMTCCSPTQLQYLSEPLRVAARWRDQSNRPVWVGEFGSYGRGPYASRVIYSRAVRDSMEAHGMSWAYWEFAAGFGLYDPSTGSMRTELRDALFF